MYYDFNSERSLNGAFIGASGSEIIGYKSQPPNNTIMIRGLAQHIAENDVSITLFLCTIHTVIKKSRNFKFFCFQTKVSNRGSGFCRDKYLTKLLDLTNV